MVITSFHFFLIFLLNAFHFRLMCVDSAGLSTFFHICLQKIRGSYITLVKKNYKMVKLHHNLIDREATIN